MERIIRTEPDLILRKRARKTRQWGEKDYKKVEEELKEFLNAIRTGKKVETGYEEGLAVIRVLEACRRSAKENVPIRLS